MVAQRSHQATARQRLIRVTAKVSTMTSSTPKDSVDARAFFSRYSRAEMIVAATPVVAASLPTGAISLLLFCAVLTVHKPNLELP